MLRLDPGSRVDVRPPGLRESPNLTVFNLSGLGGTVGAEEPGTGQMALITRSLLITSTTRPSISKVKGLAWEDHQHQVDGLPHQQDDQYT